MTNVWSSWGRRLVGLPGVAAFTSFIGLGTAAFKDTGTSGNTIPLLDSNPTFSGQFIVLQNSSQFFPQMFVRSDYNGAQAGFVNFQKTRAGGAASNGDTVGEFVAQAADTGGTLRNAAAFGFVAVTVGASTVDGRIHFRTANSGSLTDEIYFDGGLYHPSATGGAKGYNTLNIGHVYRNGAPMWGTPVTKTANFTVADDESVLINNKSGSSCTVTLPAASSHTGRQLWFKNSQAQTVVSASSNVVPRVTAAAGTAILASGSGNWCIMISDGTNWVIMAGS